MLRKLLSPMAILSVCVASLAAAEDKKDTKKGSEPSQATITKVDAKAGTITVKMKDKEGKEVERNFKLTEDIRYFDSTGRAAAIDVFQSGNDILVIEQEGKLKELHKVKNAAASIADRKKVLGNWTVQSGQDDGKALPPEKVKGSRVEITNDAITVQEEQSEAGDVLQTQSQHQPKTDRPDDNRRLGQGKDVARYLYGGRRYLENLLCPARPRPAEGVHHEGR